MNSSIRNIFLFFVLTFISSFSTGCLSIWSQQASMNEIREQRIKASGDIDAIRALEYGVSPGVAIKAVRLGDGAGVGIDVTNIEALKYNPGRQILAALGDLVLLYASKELIYDKYISSDSKSSGRPTSNLEVTVRDSSGIEINIINNGGDNGTGTIDNSSVDNSDNSSSNF